MYKKARYQSLWRRLPVFSVPQNPSNCPIVLVQLTQNWPECTPLILPIPGYRVSLAAPCHDVVIPQLKYKPGGENGKNNIITLTRPGDPASTPQPHNSERRNNNAIAHIVHKRMILRAKPKWFDNYKLIANCDDWRYVFYHCNNIIWYIYFNSLKCIFRKEAQSL